jgi:alkaline phosphatase D
MNRRTACLLLSTTPAVAADLLARKSREPIRPWIGPDFWSNPLQDWQFRNGRMECIVSGGDRHVYLLTREISLRSGSVSLRVKLGRLEAESGPLSPGFAGFRFGIKGTFNDYRDSAIYGIGMNAGVLADGRLFIGEPLQQSAVSGFPRPIELVLAIHPSGANYEARLAALDEQGRVMASVTRTEIAAAAVEGGIAVVCSAGPADVSQTEASRVPTMSGFNMQHRAREGNWRFWFSDLQASGDKIDLYPERAFGPILWTMYTLSGNVLKLTVQMSPVGERSEPVRLQVKRGSRWHTMASGRIDPLARTASFRIPRWNAAGDVPFRVLYRMNGDHTWEGTVRRDPVEKSKISVAVLSCLNDYGFPHSDVAAAIQRMKPDLAAFEGDQIYERVASYGIERLPLDRACLDYLRKWYLFGWTFRDLLRDTPAICMPDDHDVYHGNVWGAGGKHAEGTGQPAQDSGGYIQVAEWVNMMQRTQTAHLPDPYDPMPVQQGIGVYFTSLRWGGVSFAILEDRKWKSAPKVALPKAEIVNGWAQNATYQAARDGDVPGAELLGSRQFAFLDQWAQDWRGKVWMKVALSQTLFANIATLPPPANTDAVVPKLSIPLAGEYIRGDIQAADHDSNGWPQSGRNEAVRALRRASAVHLCGDQHLGSTLQYGVEDWNDGSFALCSPALSNLFPRRWYPPESGMNGRPHSPANTGQYLDGFGNRITVHAVFNPEQMEGNPNPLMDRSPGFALAEFDRDAREITMTAYARRDAKPVKGWPVRIHQLDNGWSGTKFLLPSVRADGLHDFCVQIRHQDEILYTIRIRGESFAAPVPHAGVYSVRVFEPDGKYDQTHANLEARSREPLA